MRACVRARARTSSKATVRIVTRSRTRTCAHPRNEASEFSASRRPCRQQRTFVTAGLLGGPPSRSQSLSVAHGSDSDNDSRCNSRSAGRWERHSGPLLMTPARSGAAQLRTHVVAAILVAPPRPVAAIPGTRNVAKKKRRSEGGHASCIREGWRRLVNPSPYPKTARRVASCLHPVGQGWKSQGWRRGWRPISIPKRRDGGGDGE